ncbi:hypothetical protein E2C01_019562 [Portunus trituberculatus]|uniref:Uncharacterized protein n=1 Tax=Portunus trituberculatus TaxID=210409 RepID=A0A5B7DZQ5_PORTR|nr:hypothetical protein [Portunus trituberculatus]
MEFWDKSTPIPPRGAHRAPPRTALLSACRQRLHPRPTPAVRGAEGTPPPSGPHAGRPGCCYLPPKRSRAGRGHWHGRAGGGGGGSGRGDGAGGTGECILGGWETVRGGGHTESTLVVVISLHRCVTLEGAGVFVREGQAVVPALVQSKDRQGKKESVRV